MSRVDVIMPQMGESIAEGTLTRWLKNVGDAVERDEDLFEISTDKVDADIPSPAAGVLAEVLVQDGETVEIDTVVARIETDATVAAPAADSGASGRPAGGRRGRERPWRRPRRRRPSRQAARGRHAGVPGRRRTARPPVGVSG